MTPAISGLVPMTSQRLVAAGAPPEAVPPPDAVAPPEAVAPPLLLAAPEPLTAPVLLEPPLLLSSLLAEPEEQPTAALSASASTDATDTDFTDSKLRMSMFTPVELGALSALFVVTPTYKHPYRLMVVVYGVSVAEFVFRKPGVAMFRFNCPENLGQTNSWSKAHIYRGFTRVSQIRKFTKKAKIEAGVSFQ
jgi:hypothetical protein